MIVYHGTARQFADHYRENGMKFPHTPIVGERFVESVEQAKKNAKAWSAYVLYTQGLAPEGMIVRVDLPPARIRRDRFDVLRVGGVESHELTLLGPIKFRDLDPRLNGRGPHSLGEPDGAYFERLERCLEDWERLTDRRLSVPFNRQRVRRS